MPNCKIEIMHQINNVRYFFNLKFPFYDKPFGNKNIFLNFKLFLNLKEFGNVNLWKTIEKGDQNI